MAELVEASIGNVSFFLQMVSFETKVPLFPETYYPWFMAIVIGSLGVGQQLCLIGESHRNHLIGL